MTVYLMTFEMLKRFSAIPALVKGLAGRGPEITDFFRKA
jgi:hypothetical protein